MLTFWQGMVRREGASPKEIQSQGLKCYGETLMVPRLLEKSKWKEIPNRFDKHLGTGMSRASIKLGFFPGHRAAVSAFSSCTLKVQWSM
jgi:hypothetical protein